MEQILYKFCQQVKWFTVYFSNILTNLSIICLMQSNILQPPTFMRM